MEPDREAARQPSPAADDAKESRPQAENEAFPEERARAQAREWSRLAGRWKSDISVDKEIDQILGSRTRGRRVDL